MNSNELRFQIDVAEKLQISNPTGTVVEERFGYKVAYQLADGRIMCLPTGCRREAGCARGASATGPNAGSCSCLPDAAEKLDALGLEPGEWIGILKHQMKVRQRRTVQWHIQRIDPANSEAPDTPGGDGALPVIALDVHKVPTAMVQDSSGSQPAGDRKVSELPALEQRTPAEVVAEVGKVTPISGKPFEKPAVAEPMSDMERLLAASIEKTRDEKANGAAAVNGAGVNGAAPVNGHAANSTNGAETNGHAANGTNGTETNGHAANGTAKPPIDWSDKEAVLALAEKTAETKALRSAIASLFLAQEFARSLGLMGVSFDGSDIRAIAITTMIGKQQEGRNGGRY